VGIAFHSRAEWFLLNEQNRVLLPPNHLFVQIHPVFRCIRPLPYQVGVRH
jgi:hypothetical protein